MNERRSNRRIRLLLGVFVLVFAGTLAARGLAPGRAGLDARSRWPLRQHQATIGDPGRPRHDLRPDRRAARDRRAGDHGLRRSAQREATAAWSHSPPRRRSASIAEKLYPSWQTARATSSTSSAKADPAQGGGASRKLKLPGLGFYAEELRYYPQRTGRGARAGLRRDRQQGPRRARALAGQPR